MKTRVAFAALFAALWSAGALAADSRDRTSLPVDCSDRNVTCVIDDGTPTVQQAAPADRLQLPLRDGPPIATQLPSGPGSGGFRPDGGDSAPARGRGR